MILNKHAKANPVGGFTLLELVIGMLIFVSLAIMAVAGYRAFSERRNSSLLISELKSQLRLVRSKAMSGEKPSTGCTELSGYRVLNNETSHSLSYAAVCNGEIESSREIVLTTPFESIEITDKDYFEYYAIDGSTGGTDSVISIVEDGETTQIKVLSSGEVQDN